jgi:hypothetical protein
MTSPLGQIFTGGTGRSGTTIVGELLGNHPDIWFTNPPELRFLTDEGGLLDLALHVRPASWRDWRGWKIRGENKRVFLHKMRGKWWERIGPDGTTRGLHLGLDGNEFNDALRHFAYRPGSLKKRSGRLISDLLDPQARRLGATRWVDTDPPNAMNAHRILRLLPAAKVIHVVRDGRDASASVLTMPWGPNDPMQALEWWRYRMLRSHNGISKAPEESVKTIHLESLVVDAREETYRDLLAFLELDDAPSMRTFFEETMKAENGHAKRWQREIPSDQLNSFTQRYEEIWHELSERGLSLSPLNS